MYFKDVVGHKGLKAKLIASVLNKRISHAQLFLGPEGTGSLALVVAYSRFILCKNPGENEACGTCSSCKKMDGLAHPDLHFFFPTYKTKTEGEAKNEQPTKVFHKLWREMLLETAYPTFGLWLEKIGVQNQQATFYASDCNEIIRSTSLKPFESSHNVVVVWLVEKLKASDASRLLKTLEEPPGQTVFLLLSENKDDIVKTVLSRTQISSVPFLQDHEIAGFLVNNYGIVPENARRLAFLSGGKFSETLLMMQGEYDPMAEFVDFRNWMRLCFDKNKSMIDLLKWVDNFAKEGRERQKSMLQKGLAIVRRCVLYNYHAERAIRVDNEIIDFIIKFSPFVNHNNTLEIVEKLNNAVFHIERNANPKILFAELSFTLAGLLKKRPIA